jgi:hypothetical protein
MVAARSFKEAMGREWLYANRNRFTVAYYDGKWYIFRIEQKYSVTVVLKFRNEARALAVADKLNDMFEDGEIV